MFFSPLNGLLIRFCRISFAEEREKTLKRRKKEKCDEGGGFPSSLLFECMMRFLFVNRKTRL